MQKMFCKLGENEGIIVQKFQGTYCLSPYMTIVHIAVHYFVKIKFFLLSSENASA